MSRNAHNGGSGKKSPESWQKFNFNVKPQGSGAWYPWGIWLYFLSPWHENRVGFWLAAVDTPTKKISPILPTKFLVIEGPNTCDQIEFYVFHSCLLEFLKNAGYIPVHAVYVL